MTYIASTDLSICTTYCKLNFLHTSTPELREAKQIVLSQLMLLWDVSTEPLKSSYVPVPLSPPDTKLPLVHDLTAYNSRVSNVY